VTTFEFTTLEGLHQAIQQLAYKYPEIARGEIHLEDTAGRTSGRLLLTQNTLTDGSHTYDAILGRHDNGSTEEPR
jgi:hypothetical protein